MTPELRKEASELRLHKRGIRLNLQLPVIESEDEICLRSIGEIQQRMQALQTVWQHLHGAAPARAEQGADASLSANEASFVAMAHRDLAQALAQQPELQHVAEAWYFLAWASGWVQHLAIPGQAQPVTALHELMRAAASQGIQVRRKAELLDWSDLLYRLHWAVRHAQISGREIPGRLYAPAIQQWHKAVNWLCCYDEQDDWDLVSTETGGAAVE